MVLPAERNSIDSKNLRTEACSRWFFLLQQSVLRTYQLVNTPKSAQSYMQRRRLRAKVVYQLRGTT
eukprot:909760-Amphidinium_carterae.1